MPDFSSLDFSDVPETQRPETLLEAFTDFDRRLRDGRLERYRPAPLGFPLIDQALGGGAQMEDLILIGGMQNVGKTILALQAGKNMADASEILVIKVCYEHGPQTLLLRLLCQESIADPDDPHPTGITRDQIQAVVIEHYEKVARGEIRVDPTRPFNVDWLADKLPALGRAWQTRMSNYMERLWLVRGDGIHTTLDRLERYVQMAESKGYRRIVLIVDYAQRVPFHSAGLSSLELTESQRIDLVMRGLKGIALNLQVPVIAVAAADAEGLRRQRIHVENLWGPSTVQYEPDTVIILNRDQLDTATGRKTVRVAIEKNRAGPSEIEFRHYLHGAYYCLSQTGETVSDEESFQAERIGLRPKKREDHAPGLDPTIALMFMLAMERESHDSAGAGRNKASEKLTSLLRLAAGDGNPQGMLDSLYDLLDTWRSPTN
jgi:replicative DNA helicase